MNPERIQELFNAIKLHLSSQDYDFIKYNGKIKVKKITFSASFLARKLETEEKAVYFFLSNQIEHHLKTSNFISYMPEITKEDNFVIYDKFLRDLKNVELLTQIDLERFFSNNDLKEIGNFEKIYRLYLTKKIHYFTIVNIYMFLKVDEIWKNNNDPLLNDFYFLLKKTTPLFRFKREKFLKTLKKCLSNRI